MSPLDILKSAIEGVLKDGASYGTVRFAKLAQAYAYYMVSSHEEPVLLDMWRVSDGTMLTGHVFGHKRLSQGEFIQTSAIVDPPAQWEKGATLRTMNAVYVLGTPLREGLGSMRAMQNALGHLEWLHANDFTSAKVKEHIGQLRQSIANIKVQG